MSTADFTRLAAILDSNRGNQVSEAHWEAASKKVVENGKRLESEEKATAVTRELLDKPFTI